MRSLLSVSAAVAALSLAPRAAAAQDATREAILDLLNQGSAQLQQEGYTGDVRAFDSRVLVGMLPRGGSVVLEANLRAGVRYTIIGVCDADCVDLDLRAHAPDGQAVLDEDVQTDDVPVLTFTATETGPHPLAIIMSECRADLCYFGVKVLAR